MSKKMFLFLVLAGVAFADEIDAEIINDLEFFETFEVLENMDQFQNDQSFEDMTIENSQTPQEVGNE